MVAIMIEFAVFFLLLLVALPSLLIFLMIVRELILRVRKQTKWQRDASGGLAS